MVLTQSQIQEWSAKVPEWRVDGGSISRTFRLASFPAALMFVSAIGHLAEAANHHPVFIVNYQNVTLTISTHSAGGLTEKDFSLAQQIDALPQKA
jgi:4a-hydroxytetrahydrobiopterin dehydratase